MIYFIIAVLLLWAVAVYFSNKGDDFKREDWREHNSDKFDAKIEALNSRLKFYINNTVEWVKQLKRG